MSDKTTRIPKEDILELLNELENEEKNNEPILHEKEKTPKKSRKKNNDSKKQLSFEGISLLRNSNKKKENSDRLNIKIGEAGSEERRRKDMDNRKKKVKRQRIIIIDIVMLVIILGMFLFVKCRNRDAFSDKGDYKNISLNGTWYKVDIDDMYVVKFTDEKFQEEDVFHEKSNKGTYEVGNHAMKINNKVYSMKYVNEKSDYEDMLDENEGNYDLKNYFYVIDNQGNKIYYFKKEDDAANQLDYNYQTNAYYEKSGMFDENGFAIDEDGVLLAYNGDLKEVTIPSSVKAIGENAFSADFSRGLNTEKVIVPASVKTIETGAFSFSKVKNVVLQGGSQNVKQGAYDESEITVEKN